MVGWRGQSASSPAAHVLWQRFRRCSASVTRSRSLLAVSVERALETSILGGLVLRTVASVRGHSAATVVNDKYAGLPDEQIVGARSQNVWVHGLRMRPQQRDRPHQQKHVSRLDVKIVRNTRHHNGKMAAALCR